jgi:predicted dehydrogenase
MDSRRDFLQKIGLGIGATALADLPAAARDLYAGPKADKQLRVAIMGLGSYGTRVAEAMKDCKMATLVGAVSGTPSKLEDWKKKYNIPEKNTYNYDTVSKIKDNPDIDIVYITTPNSLHHKHVLQIAAAGKHVLCEKPVADNAKQTREMIAACEKSGSEILHWLSHAF